MMHYLKVWRIAIDGICPDEGEIFRGMRRIEDLVNGEARTVDMTECIGITGVPCDSHGNCISGVDGFIEPVRIWHIERLCRRRNFINAIHAATGRLDKIREVYRVSTSKGSVFIRMCDMHVDTMMILNDMASGADRLERLRVPPVASLNL